MTSKSYWARRMKMLQEGIIKERAKDVEYIEKQYTRTIKEIEGKIRAWYQRLADNNGVSYAEAQKLLSKNELKDFHMTIEEYIEKGLSGGFEKELENASARVHISRLEALEMELQAHAEELTGKRIARTESAISDAYTESYYHTGYEVQQMAGVGVNMRKVDKKRLENVLARPWAADDKTFTARCWTDKNKLVNILEGELTRMVATGAAPDKAIKNIADAFNTSKANARRLVLTESAAMASVAEQDCYKELDVEEYEIVGTFDTKMCEDCASWHGQHFPRKDFKIGVNAPPFHPNCYCVTVPYFDDMAGIGERWMRNPETGKGEWIPSDMSYQDWKDIYIDKNSTLDEWKKAHSGIDNSVKDDIIKDGVEFYNPTTGEIMSMQKPQKYGNVADMCGKTFERGFVDALDGSDHEPMKALFYRCSDNLKVVDAHHKGGAYYDPTSKGVFIDAQTVESGTMFKKPFQTLFHEFGHNADRLLDISENDELYKAIKTDGNALKKTLYDISGLTRKPTKYEKWRFEDAAKKHFGVKSLLDNELSGVSDVLEGVTGISYPFGGGHGLDYWGTEASGYKRYHVCGEFMAHFCESSVAGDKYVAAMKKAFPNAWATLERMIWEALA